MGRVWAWVLAALLAGGAAAGATQKDGARLAGAIAAMAANEWAQAARVVAQVPDDVAKVYYDWRRLRAGEGSWRDYVAFVRDHGDWPGLPLLMRIGEAKIPSGRPAREILAYFDDQPPQTGEGVLRLVEAYEALGRGEDAKTEAIRAWKTMPKSSAATRTLLSRYGDVLRPHNFARLDHMIWEGEYGEARAMLDRVSVAEKQLGFVRIALRENKNGVNKLIDALPQSVANDPGLAYDRFRWRVRRKLGDSARELMLARSDSRDRLGRPEAWAGRRAIYARAAMRNGSTQLAYRLASQHRLKPGEDGFTDLEWLAGYIALRKLNNTEAAVTHFRALREVAVTPITMGRVWYWLGRAHAAAGNDGKAVEAYTVAARFQTSFYGQMAAIRGGLEPDAKLAGNETPDWKSAPFLASSVFRTGLLLHYADERYEAGRFFAHMAETMTETEQAQLGAFLIDLGRPNMAIRVAKNAARLGRIIPAPYYPVTELAARAGGVPPELALAIARQESEFNPDVVSSAGARGLMQVMPRTAQAVARQIGVPYSLDRLGGDWEYNSRIGTAYLAEMVKKFRGSYVLAAAAYNAGPHRASRWIAEYGDPRARNVDVEDWIEHIPFSETRNYVQRVMEALYVYRARLNAKTGPLTLERDLKRG